MPTLTPVKVYGTLYEVDEGATLADVRRAEPNFFGFKIGSRETISMHRGCLIVLNTVQFTGCAPVRKTVVYLFGTAEGRQQTFCIGEPESSNVYSARKLADRVLAAGTYGKLPDAEPDAEPPADTTGGGCAVKATPRKRRRTMTPAEAWEYAAGWGSYMNDGDPGAVMYTFNERFVIVSEEHRAKIIAHCENVCKPMIEQHPEWYKRSEMAQMNAFLDLVRERPVGKEG